MSSASEQTSASRKTIFEKLDDNTFYSPDGCWYWLGPVSDKGNGYGLLSYEGLRSAHRVAYHVHKGPIPAGLFVCHKCNNKKCINPDHLYAGTAADNSRDISLSRVNHGENQPNALLTEKDVREIRAADGDRSGRRKHTSIRTELAKKYGVSRSTIDYAIQRRTWDHI